MKTSTITLACRRLPVAAALLAVLSLPGIVNAASVEFQSTDLRAMRARADALLSQAKEAVLPLAPGETKILEAVVMATSGLVRWQADDKGPWKNAEVDDILKPGTTIRTGRKSKVFLRVTAAVLVLLVAGPFIQTGSVPAGILFNVAHVVTAGAVLLGVFKLGRR